MNLEFWQAPRWGRRGMGARWRHGRRFKRGILKFVLLKLLAEEPRHGYDLIRAFRHKGWAGGGGSIYPLLAALEEEGLIAGRDEGERRTYEITEKGRQLLGEHGDDWNSLFESDEEESAPGERSGGELRNSAERLMQAVSQVGPHSRPETIARARESLDVARKEIYSLLAEE